MSEFVIDKDDRHAHGVVAEIGGCRAVAEWSRSYDQYHQKYDPWELNRVVLEQSDKDAMGQPVWLRRGSFDYGSHSSTPDELDLRWLRSFLRERAYATIKAVS